MIHLRSQMGQPSNTKFSNLQGNVEHLEGISTHQFDNILLLSLSGSNPCGKLVNTWVFWEFELSSIESKLK